jgi:hypothetical protein
MKYQVRTQTTLQKSVTNVLSFFPFFAILSRFLSPFRFPIKLSTRFVLSTLAFSPPFYFTFSSPLSFNPLPIRCIPIATSFLLSLSLPLSTLIQLSISFNLHLVRSKLLATLCTRSLSLLFIHYILLFKINSFCFFPFTSHHFPIISIRVFERLVLLEFAPHVSFVLLLSVHVTTSPALSTHQLHL